MSRHVFSVASLKWSFSVAMVQDQGRSWIMAAASPAVAVPGLRTMWSSPAKAMMDGTFKSYEVAAMAAISQEMHGFSLWEVIQKHTNVTLMHVNLPKFPLIIDPQKIWKAHFWSIETWSILILLDPHMHPCPRATWSSVPKRSSGTRGSPWTALLGRKDQRKTTHLRQLQSTKSNQVLRINQLMLGNKRKKHCKISCAKPGREHIMSKI